MTTSAIPLSKALATTIVARAARYPTFCAGLMEEAADALLDGDFGTARILMLDAVHATIGLPALALRIGLGDRSVARLLGPAGNPTVDNLAAFLAILRVECGVSLAVYARPIRRRQREQVQAASRWSRPAGVEDLAAGSARPDMVRSCRQVIRSDST